MTAVITRVLSQENGAWARVFSEERKRVGLRHCPVTKQLGTYFPKAFNRFRNKRVFPVSQILVHILLVQGQQTSARRFDNLHTLHLNYIFFVYFQVSLRVHGSAYRWFSPSPSIAWQVSRSTGRLANSPTLLLYTGPIHRVICPVRKENDFASKALQRESNSSCTARVDPFPSALSTRPTLLLL